LRVDPALAPAFTSTSPLPDEGNVLDRDGVSTAGILVFVNEGYRCYFRFGGFLFFLSARSSLVMATKRLGKTCGKA
jgi:hypothetical protein